MGLFSNNVDFRGALLRLTLAPVGLLLVFTVVVWVGNRLLLDLNAEVVKSRNVVKTANELLLHYLNMETGFRGFLAARDEKFLDVFWEGRNKAPQVADRLRSLSIDNPDHLRALASVTQIMGKWLTYADAIRAEIGQNPQGALPRAVSDGVGKRMMDDVRGEIEGMINSEEHISLSKGENIHRTVRLATSLTLLLLLVAGFFLVLHTQREIKNLTADFQRNAIKAEQAHEELRMVNEGLERTVANRTAELEAFCYSVSHDLRAPLRGIDGFSLAIIEDYSDQLPEQGKKYLQFVRQGVQKMGRLIDDLLNLSRVSRTELRVQPVDLTKIAEEVASDLNGEGVRKVEFAAEATPQVVGDAGMLRAMMTNLLTNAWKFTQQNPEAHVEFGQMEKAGEPVFFIRDNGAGFDMAHYDKLFGAFQRLHSPNEFQGTGIGLATVRRIVRRHGGEVWAEAKVGEGATFYFKFGTPVPTETPSSPV